jgi:arylsulfatase A-like enzyme
MPAPVCEHVFVLLIDDVNGEKFFDLVDAGLVPNIKEHVLDRGSFCRHSICQFPSSSSCGHTVLATGNFPSRTGIPNADYWDATSIDMAPVPWKIDSVNVSTLPLWDKIVRAKTMFEYLPAGASSASFHVIKRGAGYKFFEKKRLLRYLGLFLKLKIQGVKDVVNQGNVLENLFHSVFKGFVRSLGKHGKPPTLTFLMYLPTDDMAHKHGLDSEEYKAAMLSADALLGFLVNGFDERGHHVLGLKDLGVYDRTAIVICADHGSESYSHDTMLDIVKHLREDITWHCYSCPVLVKGEKHGDWDALTYEAEQESPLYLRGEDGRALRAISAEQLQAWPLHGEPIDLKQYLFSFDAIARIYHPIGPDAIMAHDRKGAAMISREASHDGARWYKYEVLEGVDPLCYATDAPSLVDGTYHSHIEWLNGTVNATFPNTPDHMFGFFDCDLSPTLVATTAPGWVLFHPEDPEDRAVTEVNMHGGDGREVVTTPLVIGGAGVKHGVELDACQNVDMLPTVLRLLGIPFEEASFHGRVLEELLERPIAPK